MFKYFYNNYHNHNLTILLKMFHKSIHYLIIKWHKRIILESANKSVDIHSQFY